MSRLLLLRIAIVFSLILGCYETLLLVTDRANIEYVALEIKQVFSSPKLLGSDTFRPNHGWVVTILLTHNFVSSAHLIFSDGVDKNVFLSLDGNYEAYLDFPHDLKSLGVRLKGIPQGSLITLKWRTSKDAGSKRLGESDEIEIPL